MRALVALIIGSSALACGGGGSAPVANAPASSGATSDSPAERCLAIARAKRARKADEPAKISVKHVLVKYAGAKRAAPSVTRTREQACLRAEEARAKLEQGATFADIVKEYSEEPGAKTREGSLGMIERSTLVPPFADAAFELKAGEVSHVVETDFGFHVILRAD